jgi:glutaconate CoA-transferase subunit B
MDGVASDRKPSDRERMVVAAGRLIRDGERVFVGTYWPIPAALFAKRSHTPRSVLLFEGGLVCSALPPRIPLIASDPTLLAASELAGDVFDTLGALLHGGRADVGMLSAHSVDRYGNINTTCIGPYESPNVRLAGSGGACDFGSLAPRLILMMEHDPRRFPHRIDFITTPGHLGGGETRLQAGLPPRRGPDQVVTTLGLFGFDPESREMVLEGVYPGVTVEEVRREIQWSLRVSPYLVEIPEPTEEELRILREEVDPYGMFLRDRRISSTP